MRLSFKDMAKIHTALMTKIIIHHDQIAQTIQKERGYWTHLSHAELMQALISSGVYDKEEMGWLKQAHDFANNLPKLTKLNAEAVGAVETAMLRQGSIKGQIAVLSEMIEHTEKGSPIRFGLEFGQQMLIDGADTIYNPGFYEKHLATDAEADSDDSTSSRGSWGDSLVSGSKWVLWLAADDVAGGVIGAGAGTVGGAAAGATTGYLTTVWSGPGAGVGTVGGGLIGGAGGFVGGGLSGALGMSGRTIWLSIKDIMQPPVIHGPGDPNGPIGPHRPPR